MELALFKIEIFRCFSRFSGVAAGLLGKIGAHLKIQELLAFKGSITNAKIVHQPS